LYLIFEKTRESKSIDKQIDRLIRGQLQKIEEAALERENSRRSF
jgi:hypothetical protein